MEKPLHRRKETSLHLYSNADDGVSTRTPWNCGAGTHKFTLTSTMAGSYNLLATYKHASPDKRSPDGAGERTIPFKVVVRAENADGNVDVDVDVNVDGDANVDVDVNVNADGNADGDANMDVGVNVNADGNANAEVNVNKDADGDAGEHSNVDGTDDTMGEPTDGRDRRSRYSTRGCTML